MAQPIVQVDAFTQKPFSGNPAAVCIMPGPASENWMQQVAREVDLGATAFLYHSDDTNGYNLRWYTASSELTLCGHGTLSSAHVLWQEGHLKPDEPARFYSKAGMLMAIKRGDWIEMDFPAEVAEAVSPPPELLQALDVKPVYVGRNRLDYLVEVESEEAVRNLKPDFALLKKVQTRGIIVTSRANSPEYDCVSRFFAPSISLDEDMVTGSAHCCLGPYWGQKLNKTELNAYQASPRGGNVRMRLDPGGQRIYLSGQAVTVIRGEILATE